MAENRDNVTRRAILIRSLSSWRFFLPLGSLPLVWALVFASRSGLPVLLVLNVGYIAYGCWRLWLDAGYFRLLSEENSPAAGEALAFIWQRERLKTLTLQEREQGARRQLHRTLLATVLAWGIWIIGLMSF